MWPHKKLFWNKCILKLIIVISIADFEKAIATHCQRHVESAIRERLDMRAVRVFRLLIQKGFLEEDHVSFVNDYDIFS